MKVHRGVQISGPALRRSQGVSCGVTGNGARRKTTIHRLIEEGDVLLIPGRKNVGICVRVYKGVYDAWSAKILQSCGLKAAFISGFGVSATLLGEPDLGLLTSPEMARKAGQICNAVPDLPIIADADTGASIGVLLKLELAFRWWRGVECASDDPAVDQGRRQGMLYRRSSLAKNGRTFERQGSDFYGRTCIQGNTEAGFHI